MEHDPNVIRECALAYLAEARRCRESLRWSREELSEAEENMDAVQSSMKIGCEIDAQRFRDKTHEAYSVLVEAREKYVEQILECFSFLAESRSVCDLSDPERRACWVHWVEGKPWAEVAALVGYSVGHIKTNVVPHGLAKIYKRMPEQYRRYTIPDAQPGRKDKTK